MNNVLNQNAVIVGEPTGPTCRTCPAWVPVEGKEGGECRFNPAQMVGVPAVVQTLQGPQTSVMLQSFYPQTLEDHFCMRHPKRSAALAMLHFHMVIGALAEESPQAEAAFESMGLGNLIPKRTPDKSPPS